jgi:hypothetical protein
MENTTPEIFHNPVVGLGTFMLVLSLAGQLQEVIAKLLNMRGILLAM